MIPMHRDSILAVDPGTEQSAYVSVTGPGEDFAILDHGVVTNEALLNYLVVKNWCEHFVIEMVASYGMAVGKTTFETVFWIGRFWERVAGLHHTKSMTRLYRKADVCMHLCQSMRAKDTNVRQALIDRFGEPGVKSRPGKLYDIHTHEWSALALAVVRRDQMLSAVSAG